VDDWLRMVIAVRHPEFESVIALQISAPLASRSRRHCPGQQRCFNAKKEGFRPLSSFLGNAAFLFSY
jgi:hypothetical protein